MAANSARGSSATWSIRSAAKRSAIIVQFGARRAPSHGNALLGVYVHGEKAVFVEYPLHGFARRDGIRLAKGAFKGPLVVGREGRAQLGFGLHHAPGLRDQGLRLDPANDLKGPRRGRSGLQAACETPPQ